MKHEEPIAASQQSTVTYNYKPIIGHNATLPLFTLFYPLPGKMDYPKVMMK
jgi:hypothetical protein